MKPDISVHTTRRAPGLSDLLSQGQRLATPLTALDPDIRAYHKSCARIASLFHRVAISIHDNGEWRCCGVIQGNGMFYVQYVPEADLS